MSNLGKYPIVILSTEKYHIENEAKSTHKSIWLGYITDDTENYENNL
jgi:hypothetical protein